MNIIGNANAASLSISASLNCTSGNGSFEVRLGDSVTVAGNRQSFDQTVWFFGKIPLKEITRP